MAKVISQTIVIDVQKLVPNKSKITPLLSEAEIGLLQQAMEEILSNRVIEIEFGESEFKS